MSNEDQARTLAEIRDILKQQLDQQAAERAANAAYRKKYEEDHAKAIAHSKVMARIGIGVVLLFVLICFLVMTTEVKKTINSSLQPDPVKAIIEASQRARESQSQSP